MTTPLWLNELNEQQRAVVTSPLGNHLVLAGAGSGKTRVLVSRMAYLVDTLHLSPHALLAVTFTNKAALELKTRLGQLLNVPIQHLWVGTFHGLCHRLLRRHATEAHLPMQFHILDTDDQTRVIKRIMTAMNLDLEQWPVKQALQFINKQKEAGLRPQHVHETFQNKTWLIIYRAYEQACQTAGGIDFAEILLRTHELLRDNPPLLAQYQSRFQALLVDEFQDTNPIQYAWIRLLAGPHASVMVVGDDDQSIYGWRGAKIENIQRFSSEFKPCSVTRLEQNYRSTATILGAANALIAHNTTRMGKNLWTDGADGDKIQVFCAFNEIEEARFVSDQIRQKVQQGYKAQDMAVLYRSNAQSRVFEEAFLRAGIAYRIHGGMRYFERAEIKDALAYVRLTQNQDDDIAFDRVLNRPARGIGEKTHDTLRTLAQANQCSLWQAAHTLLSSESLTSRAHTALSRFMTLMATLREDIAPLTLDEQIQTVLERSGLYTYFHTATDPSLRAKVENLEELVNAAKEFKENHEEDDAIPLMMAFLAHTSLESGEQTSDDTDATVHLMTLHAAKGLEFPCVFLVGMEEGLFPSPRSAQEEHLLEEERRLCYVGMTRARAHLCLSWAEVRRQYGREEQHRPSRFLRELPEDLLLDVRGRTYPSHTSRTTYTPTPDNGFRLGQHVAHPKFGSGVIVGMEGQGAHARVQVNFDHEGTKWLVLAYARLVA